MLKLLKECKKYSVSTYTQVEISLNTCRNTLDFMCDLELFSKIRSHIMLFGYDIDNWIAFMTGRCCETIIY